MRDERWSGGAPATAGGRPSMASAGSRCARLRTSPIPCISSSSCKDARRPVYEQFLADYPTLVHAARADPRDICARLKPLGLEWRARSAVAFVQEARARYGDELPVDPDAITRLPGAGEYVSAAVACFAGGSAEPLVDTNVARVLGRVFGVRSDPEARRRKETRELAKQALDQREPEAYHYALLDFAAIVCVPRRPRCSVCPLGADVCISAKRL